MNRKVERQPQVVCIQPPSTGAMAGAKPNTIMTTAVARWASCPLKWSCTMARPTMPPAPDAKPCKARSTNNAPKLGAQAAANEVTVNTAMATTKTERRPKESDKVPKKSIMVAMHRM